MSENIGENITRRLAEHVATLRYEDIPPSVIERVKLFVADFVGIAVRAAYDAASTPPMIAAAEALEKTESVLRSSPRAAALLRRSRRSSTAPSVTRWTSTP